MCIIDRVWYRSTVHISHSSHFVSNGPLTSYANLRVAHAPGMPGTFSPPANFKRNRYSAIPACITARASRTCRDACRDRLPVVAGKTFPTFPAHAHPQFNVSGKRPMYRTYQEMCTHTVGVLLCYVVVFHQCVLSISFMISLLVPKES